MDEQLTLYLVRHGETEWSLSGQHTGSSDIPLTAHGEEQAHALAATLGKIPFAHVFSSPLRRALRTCELAGMPAPTIDADLIEWRYGTYEGQRSAQIAQQRPGWNIWNDGCPDGETPAEICARADRLIARLCRLRGNVALFSHGHFGCALAARWIGLAIAHGQHFALDPASVSRLGSPPRHTQTRAFLSWNVPAQNATV